MFKWAVLEGVFVNVEETVTLKETKLQDVNKLSIIINVLLHYVEKLYYANCITF